MMKSCWILVGNLRVLLFTVLGGVHMWVLSSYLVVLSSYLVLLKYPHVNIPQISSDFLKGEFSYQICGMGDFILSIKLTELAS